MQFFFFFTVNAIFFTTLFNKDEKYLRIRLVCLSVHALFLANILRMPFETDNMLFRFTVECSCTVEK